MASGVRRDPAIDIEASISRVANDITPPEQQAAARRFRQLYSAYRQNRDLLAIGAYQKGSDPRVDSAISDLRAGRIDIVWLDQQPAAEFVQGGGLKFVAQGLNPQSYAIAVCKGATHMVGEINRAISQLSSQGVIGQLSSQYLNLDNAVNPPTPTPTSPSQPTATPAPPPPCVDAMHFSGREDHQKGEKCWDEAF